MSDRGAHWEDVYRTRAAETVSWFQPSPIISLELIAASGVSPSTAVIDVGAGASSLVDGLLERGYRDVTLLDIASSAFESTRARLRAHHVSDTSVQFVVADVTTWRADRSYGLWHDRAVFHFLTDPAERMAYREALASALAPGGTAILATFADDGPERCSGLPIQRYSEDALARELGDGFRQVTSRRELHRTPAETAQSFVYVVMQRL